MIAEHLGRCVLGAPAIDVGAIRPGYGVEVDRDAVDLHPTTAPVTVTIDRPTV